MKVGIITLKQQRRIVLALWAVSAFISSCSDSPDKALPETGSSYFLPVGSGVQTGGVNRIPIHTPKGTFHVWTKRIGNNPAVKVLLLHGGPGGAHDAFE